MLPGRDPIPTAARVPVPASLPKMSTIRSLKPFMTSGCCENPGTAFTMPNVRTSLATRSRLPILALIVASMLMPHWRAAALPSSIVRSLPTIPWCPGDASGIRGVCPATYSMLPTMWVPTYVATGGGGVWSSIPSSLSLASGLTCQGASVLPCWACAALGTSDANEAPAAPRRSRLRERISNIAMSLMCSV